jgi:hypothetical protein
MTVLQLREKVIFHTEEARKIKDKADEESRGMTEEEVLEFDKNMREADRIEAEADRQERLEAREAKLAKPEDRKSTPEIATGEKIEIAGPKLYRAGQLRAFKGPKADEHAYRSGKFLLATIMDDAASPTRWSERS